MGLLCLIDGTKVVRKAISEVFGIAVVKRCQWHKQENVISYIPKHAQGVIRKRLQNAHSKEHARRRYKGSGRIRGDSDNS